MTLNTPLLRKAVEWAEAEAEKPILESEWFQQAWHTTREQRVRTVMIDHAFQYGTTPAKNEYGDPTMCGTAYCIAGYICHVMGDTFVMRDTDVPMQRDVLLPNGGTETIERRAADHLGIDAQETWSLFQAGNNIRDVRHAAARLAVAYGDAL